MDSGTESTTTEGRLLDAQIYLTTLSYADMDSGTDSTATGGRLIDAQIYLTALSYTDMDSGTDSTATGGRLIDAQIYLRHLNQRGSWHRLDDRARPPLRRQDLSPLIGSGTESTTARRPPPRRPLLIAHAALPILARPELRASRTA